MSLSRHENIVIAGFGGQGVLSIGRVIAQAGMEVGLNVSWLPSYGPEMRGGTAYVHVILSDGPVGSPLLNSATTLIAMNRPSYEKYVGMVDEGGLVIVDGSLVDVAQIDADSGTDTSKGRRLFSLPATRKAVDSGRSAFANVILAGKLINETGIVTVEAFEKALRKTLSKRYQSLIPQEMELLAYGMGWEPSAV